MPILRTKDWVVGPPQSRFLDTGNGIRLPVFVRPFAQPNHAYSIVFPQSRLSPDLWKAFIVSCQHNALFDPDQKYWCWSNLTLDKVTSTNAVSSTATTSALTNQERAALRAERAVVAAKFDAALLELSKHENVPENLWTSYSYPPHYLPYTSASSCPEPTALQRIVVSRYWNRPSALIAASVGTGKSRMVVDTLCARALSPEKGLNDSARIVLVVAPLALHENWKREFAKWAPGGVTWRVSKFAPKLDFWREAEASATYLFDGPKMIPGGVVIIVTPNTLSRPTVLEHFKAYGWVPTCIVVDEIQRFFRNPNNRAYKNLMKLRATAHMFLGLSGTPTSKLEDWHALESLVTNNASDAHWRGATYSDYQRLGDVQTFASSGLHCKGWDFARGIKEFHAWRIKQGTAFCADKFFYMKDSLPGIGQEELGEYADLRLSFPELMTKYPEWVEAAWELQKTQNPGTFAGNDFAMATTLMLRMRQLAATSEDTKRLLKEFVEEFLDDGEPAVFWCEFRNDPCNQISDMVDILNQYGPTCYIQGGMTDALRQEAIDGFQAGKYRFTVNQTDAGGVGLTLTRACKTLFLTVPLGYQATTQAIGRLHRIGQQNDVMSYFAMTSPIAAFARAIYDRRAELNEMIPQQISGVLKQIVDAPAVAA